VVGEILGSRFDGRSYVFGRDARGMPEILVVAAQADTTATASASA
jgi:hypothetical protein